MPRKTRLGFTIKIRQITIVIYRELTIVISLGMESSEIKLIMIPLLQKDRKLLRLMLTILKIIFPILVVL